MVSSDTNSKGKIVVKTKQPSAMPQAEYHPPSWLKKCPFATQQKFFWLETSEWFRAFHRFNNAAQYDDDREKMQCDFDALKRAVPEIHRERIRLVMHSVFQAFNIVQGKDLSIDVKHFPKGGKDIGAYNWDEWKKRNALFLIKHGSALWNPKVDPGLQQAIKDNDIEFFRRDFPETLNDRRKVVCFDPDEPERGILQHWLVSFWCHGDYWPAWADSNLPPLCIFTDQAIADFLSSGKDRPCLTSATAIEQCRKRLGLNRFTTSIRIKRVDFNNGYFLLAS